MIEKLTKILKEKIGDNFKEISQIYKKGNDFIVFMNSKNREIELPVAIISNNSIKFYPYIYIIKNEDSFFKNAFQIYPFDQEDENDEVED